MGNNSKIAIVAALEREVHPLVKSWTTERVACEGKSLRLHSSEKAVVVCAGMGAAAARRAAGALLERITPSLIISAGFARALVSDLHVGDVIIPAEVLGIATKKSYATLFGAGQLWTSDKVVENSDVPSELRLFEGKGVDMEAAGVAEVAAERRIPFIAVKAISDELTFVMPPVGRFIRQDGGFRTAPFLRYVSVRPKIWRSVVALAINSSTAATRLCSALGSLVEHRTVQGYDLNVELARLSGGAVR